MQSEDLPFVIIGGEDTQTALHNRVGAINRINYIVRQKLPNFDIREKSDSYLRCLDLELWKEYYKEEPTDKKIDETFCQRTAKVCIDMDSEMPFVDDAEFKKEVEKAKIPVNKDNWVKRFFKKK